MIPNIRYTSSFDVIFNRNFIFLSTWLLITARIGRVTDVMSQKALNIDTFEFTKHMIRFPRSFYYII